ncbi:Flp pilus assembly protein CpaB [Cohnella thailandensis]|uniref:Flagellar biosynthesis protein FlgA n=1 Tax=Cohnella thailandensis TaxID=557557 RepID=A0A841T9F4_9BACL|nr:flagellar biosynthesis protein FlgA [Cohnella thailandensis]MBB6638477.1 flagellar biosynthesis protein FlgA [Cohnella thailandensis]MBP1977463.1 Flp pilus assembly protein CpaB [Cohnella thailandensis]
MNRKRQLTISLAAALLSGMLVYSIYWLQIRQIREEEMVKVVVPKQFIPAGTILEEGMLSTISLAKASVQEGMLTRIGEASGLQAVAPLGAEEPLLAWKVERFPLLPRPGEATFQIPRNYVKSVSNGIRAGDRVGVYLSSDKEPSRRLYAEAVVVAAVKTAANTEIESPENSSLESLTSGDKEKMYASRRDANGTIDSVNLNLTERQWLELDAACKDGSSKVVIAYEASAIDMEEEEGA